MRTAKMGQSGSHLFLFGRSWVGVWSLGIIFGFLWTVRCVPQVARLGIVPLPFLQPRLLELDTLRRHDGVESVRQDGDATQEE